MRLCRYDEGRLGVVEGSEIADVTAVLQRLPAMRYPYPPGDPLIAALPQLRGEIAELAKGASRVPLDSVRLLSPIAMPGKIIGAPANYMKHIEEVAVDPQINQGVVNKTIDTLGLFLKAGSSLVGPSEGMRPFPDRRTDHEAELVAVIGKAGKDIPYDEAMDYVAGYALGLDMTVRGPEDRSLRKSIDTYAVLGPWFVTADEIADPGKLTIQLRVNGELRQDSTTGHMIFDTPKLISYASRFYTLQPGDLIYTGTPEGVSPVTPGDVMEVTIPEIGTMRVAVH